MRKSFFVLFVAISMMMSVLVCQPVAYAVDEIKIGAIFALSGSVAPIGQSVKQALDLAVKEVNREGGIKSLGGAKIKLVFADSRGDAKIGLSEAERLILQDKVVAIVGAHQSSVTMTSTQVAEKYKVSMYLLAHAGDGNMHPLITYDPDNKDEAERVEKAVREIFETSIALGGTLTGEHGIGLAKKEFMSLEVTPAELQVWKNIKKCFDPDGILNPGKFV